MRCRIKLLFVIVCKVRCVQLISPHHSVAVSGTDAATAAGAALAADKPTDSRELKLPPDALYTFITTDKRNQRMPFARFVV